MTQETVKKQVTAEDTLSVFDSVEMPFVTSAIVANELGCSDQTARNRLKELLEEGLVERHDLDGRRTLYFREDYRNANEVAEQLREHLDFSELRTDYVEAFAKKPYKVLPKTENEYYVVTPRFVPFTAGHLREKDEAWKTFIINKYVDWIEDIPDSIRETVNIDKKYDHAVVDGEYLKVNTDQLDAAWDEFSQDRHQDAIPSDERMSEMEWDRVRKLASRLGVLEQGMTREEVQQALSELRDEGEVSKIKINKSSEFEVIAQLIEDGNLPFAKSPIDESDIRQPAENVDLRPYQERAWSEFRDTGQIGVYWAPGLGKTFFSLYAGSRISGKKLVVVPSSTLEDQWEKRIEKHTDRPYEWDVRTYQYLTQNNNMQEYQDGSLKLTVFDECHTLPANTFSKLSTLDTDYRIGLSATPYREDERTDYIFALTGVPVGMEWEELLEYGNFDYPRAKLYLYRTEKQKAADLKQLASESTGKTLVFCDSIDKGETLSEEIDAPFVHGETPKSDRIDTIEQNHVSIVSRVGDEGLSLDDIDRVIEFDFHGSSRRQELQRAGRLMHNQDGDSIHILQMTDEEFEKFGDRVNSLEEKGVRTERVRRA